MQSMHHFGKQIMDYTLHALVGFSQVWTLRQSTQSAVILEAKTNL